MTMDLNDIRSLFVIIMPVMFIAIWVWAWSGKRERAFSEAARLPLDDDGVLTEDAVRGKENDHG